MSSFLIFVFFFRCDIPAIGTLSYLFIYFILFTICSQSQRENDVGAYRDIFKNFISDIGADVSLSDDDPTTFCFSSWIYRSKYLHFVLIWVFLNIILLFYLSKFIHNHIVALISQSVFHWKIF